jgi:ABC-type lipoprotein export system ATPase subunit
MNDIETILRLTDIRKEFGVSGTSSLRVVLSGLSLTVKKGESLAITGPSGSGKTTLLNLIAALDKPDKGLIEFKGRNLAGYSSDELDTYRNQSIGIVFQLHHLLPQCTLLENILVPTLAVNNKAKRAFYLERAGELIRRMGLWEVRNQYPGTLSGGECQRTAVARALINDPDLLLADEPTGALDQANALNLVELLTEINRIDGKTIIMVTHSAEMAARMERTVDLITL